MAAAVVIAVRVETLARGAAGALVTLKGVSRISAEKTITMIEPHCKPTATINAHVQEKDEPIVGSPWLQLDPDSEAGKCVVEINVA